ncbi:MAG TPA: HEAT repeat domain-containing protein [Bellilinea sp.]|nr:HEAT repeat domain-containing protein [Bellilinea sp.]
MLPPTESHDPASRSEIYGLATIAGHATTPRDLRIKAIRALARIPDQNAIRVLGEMALWEQDEELRNEANRSLEATFGDDLPEVLESIRQELTGNWVESNPDEDDDEDEETQNASEYQIVRQPEYQTSNQTPRVEGTPLGLLWVVLGLVILGGVLYFMFFR